MNSKLLRPFVLLGGIAMSGIALAGEKLESVPEAAPPPPPRVQSGETLEPDITIRDDKQGQVEEYRAHGRLYMVKITPKIGKPYYLLDSDGDGKLETRMSHLNSNFVVPSWVIFSWD